MEAMPSREDGEAVRCDSDGATCCAGTAATAEKNLEIDALGATSARFRRAGPLPLKAPDIEVAQALRALSGPVCIQCRAQGRCR